MPSFDPNTYTSAFSTLANTSEGFDRVAFQTTVAQWVLLGTGLPVGKVYWSSQSDAPRPTEPAVAMKLMSENDASLPWQDSQTNYLTFTDIVVSSITGSVFTTGTAHGLQTGDGPVNYVATTYPGGLAASTSYWVVVLSPTTFSLAAGFQAAMMRAPVTITITSVGTGTQTLVATGVTLRAGQEVVYYSRSNDRLILTLECFAVNGVSQDAAMNYLRRLISRSALPSMQAILSNGNVGLNQFDRVRFVKGVRDAVILEPRASLDVRLNVASEASEFGSTIDLVQLTNQLTGLETDIDGDV